MTYKPTARSLRKFCTPQKHPSKEAQRPAGTLPDLPTTEAEALQRLKVALTKLAQPPTIKQQAPPRLQEFVSMSGYRYAMALHRWDRAASAERQHWDGG